MNTIRLPRDLKFITSAYHTVRKTNETTVVVACCTVGALVFGKGRLADQMTLSDLREFLEKNFGINPNELYNIIEENDLGDSPEKVFKKVCRRHNIKVEWYDRCQPQT